jgi:ATP-dependent DNA ligase
VRNQFPPAMNIAPIIPIRRREAFDDPAFLFELKYDGFRALADTVNGRILSKNTNRATV